MSAFLFPLYSFFSWHFFFLQFYSFFSISFSSSSGTYSYVETHTYAEHYNIRIVFCYFLYTVVCRFSLALSFSSSISLQTPVLCILYTPQHAYTMYCHFSEPRPFFVVALFLSSTIGSLSVILLLLSSVILLLLLECFFFSFPVLFLGCKRMSNENGDDNSVCGKSKREKNTNSLQQIHM